MLKHIISDNQTVEDIANLYNVSVQNIIDWNKLEVLDFYFQSEIISTQLLNNVKDNITLVSWLKAPNEIIPTALFFLPIVKPGFELVVGN